jgi:hypothetical protein
LFGPSALVQIAGHRTSPCVMGPAQILQNPSRLAFIFIHKLPLAASNTANSDGFKSVNDDAMVSNARHSKINAIARLRSGFFSGNESSRLGDANWSRSGLFGYVQSDAHLRIFQSQGNMAFAHSHIIPLTALPGTNRRKIVGRRRKASSTHKIMAFVGIYPGISHLSRCSIPFT